MAAKCAAILLQLVLMICTDTGTCTPDVGSNNRSPETNPSVFPFLRSVFSTAIGAGGDNSNNNRQSEIWLPDIGDFGFRIPQLIQPGEQQLPSHVGQQPPPPPPVQSQSNGNIRHQYPNLPQQHWQGKPGGGGGGQQGAPGQQSSSSSMVTSPPQIRRVIFGRCPDFPCPSGLICDLKSNSCRHYYYDY